MGNHGGYPSPFFDMDTLSIMFISFLLLIAIIGIAAVFELFDDKKTWKG